MKKYSTLILSVVLLCTGIQIPQTKADVWVPDFQINAGSIISQEGGSVSGSWIDYDGDGDLDLITANNGDFEDYLYKNNGDGTFTKDSDSVLTVPSIPVAANTNEENNWMEGSNFLAGITGGGDDPFAGIDLTPAVEPRRTEQFSFVDFDNDGDLDVFTADKEYNQILRNDGNGIFTEYTSFEIGANQHYAKKAKWGDYNNDTYPDLFLAQISDGAYPENNNLLFHNNGDGTLTEITTGDIVTESGESYDAEWADYDTDGDLDLFVANYGSNNFLYQNNGNGTFTKVTSGDIVTDGGNSKDAEWADFDNDNDLDLFVANYGSNNFLYQNNGDGTFTKITNGGFVNDGGSSNAVKTADFDNDGDIDIFVGNGNLENNTLYINTPTFYSGTIDYTNDGNVITPITKTGAIALPQYKDTALVTNDQYISVSSATESALLTENIGGVDINTALDTLAKKDIGAAKKFRFQKGESASEAKLSFLNNGYRVEFNHDTTFYSGNSWNGSFIPAKRGTTSPSRFILNGSSITVGAESEVIISETPVKITLPITTGDPHYTTDGIRWTAISECSDATSTSAGSLSFPNECFIEEEGNTIIWTYHFTTFGSLTPADSSIGGIILENRNATETTGSVEVTFENGSIIPADGIITLSFPDEFATDDIADLTSGSISIFTDDGSDISGNIGSAELTSNVMTISLDGSASIAANSEIKILFGSGVLDTNPTQEGEYAVALTTQESSGAVLETGYLTADIGSIEGITTDITVTVLEALIMTLDNTAVTLTVDPSVNNGVDQSQKNTLTVSTNSPTYMIQAKLENTQGTEGLYYSDGTTDHYIANGISGENVFGFNTTAAGEATNAFSSTEQTIFANQAGNTNSQAHSIFYDLDVDYLTQAGIYQGVITYTAVPAF